MSLENGDTHLLLFCLCVQALSSYRTQWWLRNLLTCQDMHVSLRVRVCIHIPAAGFPSAGVV